MESMLQASDCESLALCECTCAYYVGMHRAGIRPIERHRWHYTYWQDTRDRPQVWVAGVTALVIYSSSHGWYPWRALPPSAADDISAVMPSESAERRRERQRNFLYHYQRTTARSLLAKLEALRLGQVGLHEKRRVYTATSTWLSSDLAIVFGYY